MDGVRKRFDAKWELDAATGCWNWTGALIGKGYGQFQVRKHGKDKNAHRWSWRLHRGEIPEGEVICHKCDNPKCVNPDHLFLGTHSDNSQDMVGKDRHLYGERNGSSKLTTDTVLEIHKLAKQGISQQSIATKFGIGQMTVCRIIRGERWRHIFNIVNTTEP